MLAADACNRIVNIAGRTLPLVQAAQPMRHHHAGCLLALMAEQLHEMATVIATEYQREHRDRP